MSRDQSVPLSKALERFSDPSAWRELCSLEPYAQAMFVFGGAPAVDDRYNGYYRRQWLKARLEAELLDKLITGTLVATGEVCPVRLDPERAVIPKRRWRELQPDFAASEATTGDLRIVNIEVAPSSPSCAGAPSELRDQASLARLRAALRDWLLREVQVRGRSWYKRHYREAAREKYGEPITDNLFDEVWRSAELPAALRKPGLRKKRDLSTDPSPSD